MKQLIQLSILSNLLLSTHAFAINPVEGFYGGLIAEISHGPSNDDILFREDDLLFNGTVKYSPVSGGGGGFIGYKYRHFRVEGELLYNRITTGPLTVGTCTLESPNILTPTGTCPQPEYDHFQSKALGYNGSSAALYGLVNAYWDFFSYDGQSYIVPYLGIGVGQGRIKNSSNFVNTVNQSSHGHSTDSRGMAGQGIIGLSYYMDDFTWLGMDYRYLSTKNKANLNVPQELIPSKTYVLNTLNFTISFAFDKGAIN